MLKRIVALSAALVVPFFLFVVVISLNESAIDKEEKQDKQVNFDVNKQKQIKQQKPKQKPKPKRRKPSAQTPSIKPSGLGSSLSGSGLSFGIPQFDEAKFSDISDGGLLDSVAGKALDKETVDTAPKVLRRSPVVYPELARRQGISGYVTMNVLIDESGNVEDVEIIESKPEEIFDLKANDTIRRWKFEPATYNGKKVKVWAMQKIVFKLD
ncbi:MAG: energy transducer TonB [Gammaproteobacteria bacterium]|nr:energy transducer TonB [Gammaproteobacteria bacterium]